MPLQSEDFIGNSMHDRPNDRHKMELAIGHLRSGGSIRFVAQGTSMAPALWPGDVLTVDGHRESLICGDIVMVHRDGRVVVHRLIAQDHGCWITRGDGMPENDQPVESQNVLGKVVRVQRGKREWSPSIRVPLLHRCVARVFARSDRMKSFALRCRNASRALRNSQRTAPGIS